MSFNSEYQKLRQKRKEQEQNSYNNVFTVPKGKNSIVDIGPVKPMAKLNGDIGPVNNTVTTIDDKESAKDDTLDFFKKGAMEEGATAKNIGKAILGTLGDAGLGISKGLFGLGEGLSDAVGYAAAGVADLIGKKGWADDIRRTTQDNYTDDLFEVLSEKVENESVLGRTSRGVMEGVGQAAGLVATAGIGGMAGLGVKGTTALTSAMTGLSGFGSGTSEAYQSGATDKEAVTYGMISAASDVLTEMLFGGLGKGANAIGLGKGLSSADDMLAKKVSNMFSNQIMKNFSEFGIKASAEGVEEVLAGVTQAFGKKLTYMSEEDLSEILKDENLFEQFVVGSVTSGIMQAGDLHRANTHKTDFIGKELSQNEQAVFDKIYNDRVNEAKKGGKKLSGKDKENIHNSVMNDIEKGYIGINDIESVLGGETYRQYQSAVEEDNRMKELQSEYDTLYKMKNGEKSDEQIDRQKELKQQLDEYKNTSKLRAIQDQLSNEVSELAKTSKLVESYNEKSRRSQAFEADLTQYDEKHQGTYKRAMESGVLNNSNRTHEFVDLLAKLEADKGVLFDFTNNEKIKETGFAIEGKQVNGYVQGNNIAINIDSTSAFNKVVGHEITHVLEGTELYTELANAVKELATTKGEYDSKLQSITKLYESIENANIENELTADLIGEYLFTDSDFINRLSAEKPTLFKKIFDEIKYLCKVATAGSKEARQLEKVKKTFEEAYRQKNNTATDDGVKYAIDKKSLENVNDLEYNNDTHYGETLIHTSEHLKPTTDREWQIFCRSFANKTNGLNDGEHKGITIFTADYQYLVGAEGYMKGTIYSKISIDEYNERNDFYDSYSRTEVFDSENEGDGNRQGDNLNSVLAFEDKGADTFDVELDKFIRNHPEYFKNTQQGHSNINREQKLTSNNTDPITKESSTDGSFFDASKKGTKTSNSAEDVKDVFGYKISQDAEVNEDLLEDMSYYHPDAEVDTQGNITVYHRTTKANADKIKQTGIMTAKEDALFFSSKESGYASGYGDTVVKMKIPSTELRLNDVFDGEVHFDLPLKYKNGGYSLDVSKYIVDDTKMSLSNDNDDIGPVRERNNVYGEDIKLQVDGPVREDIKSNVNTTENNIPKDLGPTAEDIKKQNTLVTDDAEFTILDDVETENNNNVQDVIDEKAVKQLTSRVVKDLGIGKSKANRTAVKELVQSLSNNDINSKEALYNAVSEKFGTQYIEELNDELIEARSYIRETKINVPDSVKGEFGSMKDYRTFQKKNFGKLWISKDGSGIDQIYAELNEMYPHLFPDDIWNQADQLKQISDVVNKPKSQLIPMEIDAELIQKTTDLIYDSVNEYRDVMGKVNNVTDNIETADISDKVKEQIKDELFTAYEKIEAEFNIDKKNLVNKLEQRRALLKEDTADRTAYLKKKANELYTESTQMEKGKRATPELGLLLDTIKATYPDYSKNEIYRTLRTTLLNIRNRPGSTVNVNSEIEKLARELINDKFDSNVQELNDFDWTMEDEISNLESKAEEKRYNAKLAVNGKLIREIMDAEQVAMIGDTSLWKDKSKGFMYKTNTEHRNFRDIVKDKFGKTNIKLADALNDYFMGTYNHNEAELKRKAAVIQKKFADLKLNKYEDVFVQMKGEFLHNPHTELTQHDIDTFTKLYGKQIDESKVDNAINMARETYDSLIERMNEVLVAHGMKPIEYRRGYFPHFSEVEKTKWQKFTEKFLNWKTQNNDIPTDIAGMTESFKPNRSWQSFNKQRIGDETDYSFMKGFDGYLQGSLDWIYHIDDIMKRRVFENRIRYDHSDEGVKKQIQEIYKNNEFDTNAKQEQIDLVFREAENPLNNFIVDFRTRTNTLAGKKSSMDRGMEEFTSRKFYSTATNLNNRINANMVVGSVSSALTNFIPITQSWGEVSPVSSLKAMGDTIKSAFKDDGTINKSDFLTNRLNNVEKLYQTGWDKAINKAGWLMESIDSFTSQTVWRSKYHENMSKGMSEAEAIKNADQFAENVLAGRSRGNMPTIFDSKNPLIKMATAFQLEVNNQYGYMFKDMPQDMKNESLAKLAKGYATMFIGAWAYNAAYSALTGRDAAFDPIGIIQELLGDLFDDEEDKPADVIMGLTDNVLEELPFVGGFLGGGRVPISSALPYDDGIRGAFEGTVTDLTEGDIGNLTKEWLLSAGTYLLLPAGGGQIKKTAQGLSMFLDDDLPIAGSYTDSGKLRFTVEETMDEMIKAGFFGQYASKNARQYFDENRSPLSDKKTQELIDLDVPIEKYWEYQDGLKALGEHATLNEKGDYIANLEGFTVEQKNILINNIADRDEPIDLTGYENYSDFQEFDFATRYPEKYAVLQECGISVSEYKEKYEEKAIIYTDDFSWASNNAEKFTVSKAVTDDVTEYKKYTSDLSNIKSDKDKNGNSISGSAKRKKVAYINSLDIEKGAKLILYKSQYKSDDTYNTQIIEYLKGRKDITRAEKETILTELGFTVHKDGRVTW